MVLHRVSFLSLILCICIKERHFKRMSVYSHAFQCYSTNIFDVFYTLPYLHAFIFFRPLKKHFFLRVSLQPPPHRLRPLFSYSVNTRTSQPFPSIFPCSPLPSGTWRTPGLSIPRRCLSTSSSVCLVFFPLSLCPARRFWQDLCFTT